MIHFVEITRAIKVDDGGQGVEESLLNRCRIAVWKCRKARVNAVNTTEQFPKEYKETHWIYLALQANLINVRFLSLLEKQIQVTFKLLQRQICGSEGTYLFWSSFGKCSIIKYKNMEHDTLTSFSNLSTDLLWKLLYKECIFCSKSFHQSPCENLWRGHCAFQGGFTLLCETETGLMGKELDLGSHKEFLFCHNLKCPIMSFHIYILDH